MNIVDILIIIFLILGTIVGFKQGFTRSLVSLVGLVLVTIVAYILKNPVSSFLMDVFPFFQFDGIVKGVTALNIALYEIIAFLLVFGVLMIILRIIAVATGFFEKVLSFTIVLGIPSKILGAILGLLKTYIIIFFALYILSFPSLANVSWMQESKFREPILTNTPVLSEVANDMAAVFNEFAQLSNKYSEISNSNEFNLEAIDLFLKYNVVTVEQVEKLIENDKIRVEGIEPIIEKYKEAE